MPIQYGVLKGHIVNPVILGKDNRHLEVKLKVPKETDQFRISINIHSLAYPSEVLYCIGEDFHTDHITILPNLKFGFTKITQDNIEIAIDYVRGHLFDPSVMKPLPNLEPGPDNDLYEKLSYYLDQAIEKQAVIYAYGERWGPDFIRKDEYFEFLPGNGIHNIHMNQGSVEPWKKDNGIWQDGGILIHFEEEKRWIGLFLAFQSQSWCTDENGHSIQFCGHIEHQKGEY